jgi:CsoR family transcriptional regulator, copper-sensing transcriptional repressor
MYKDQIMPKGIPRNQNIQQKILHRLKIARGQLDGVIQMVEGDDYCIDVIHQSMAVQSALRETDHIILKNHMETCVADAIAKGDKAEVIGEVMKVMEKR